MHLCSYWVLEAEADALRRCGVPEDEYQCSDSEGILIQNTSLGSYLERGKRLNCE